MNEEQGKKDNKPEREKFSATELHKKELKRQQNERYQKKRSLTGMMIDRFEGQQERQTNAQPHLFGDHRFDGRYLAHNVYGRGYLGGTGDGNPNQFCYTSANGHHFDDSNGMYAYATTQNSAKDDDDESGNTTRYNEQAPRSKRQKLSHASMKMGDLIDNEQPFLTSPPVLSTNGQAAGQELGWNSPRARVVEPHQPSPPSTPLPMLNDEDPPPSPTSTPLPMLNDEDPQPSPTRLLQRGNDEVQRETVLVQNSKSPVIEPRIPPTTLVHRQQTSGDSMSPTVDMRATYHSRQQTSGDSLSPMAGTRAPYHSRQPPTSLIVRDHMSPQSVFSVGPHSSVLERVQQLAREMGGITPDTLKLAVEILTFEQDKARDERKTSIQVAQLRRAEERNFLSFAGIAAEDLHHQAELAQKKDRHEAELKQKKDRYEAKLKQKDNDHRERMNAREQLKIVEDQKGFYLSVTFGLTVYLCLAFAFAVAWHDELQSKQDFCSYDEQLNLFSIQKWLSWQAATLLDWMSLRMGITFFLLPKEQNALVPFIPVPSIGFKLCADTINQAIGACVLCFTVVPAIAIVIFLISLQLKLGKANLALEIKQIRQRFERNVEGTWVFQIVATIGALLIILLSNLSSVFQPGDFPETGIEEAGIIAWT